MSNHTRRALFLLEDALGNAPMSKGRRDLLQGLQEAEKQATEDFLRADGTNYEPTGILPQSAPKPRSRKKKAGSK